MIDKSRVKELVGALKRITSGTKPSSFDEKIMAAMLHADLLNQSKIALGFPEVLDAYNQVMLEENQKANDEYEERKERAMEEGMLQGLDAYNEIMGYD